ncbi:hypothetical protein E4U19_006435 [Claviceps sp. Clav32 group G5]|nr:hypothetical protein E4U40_001363 [Claviceps sp. LM458 group G5]KAG6033486.1 hypothetical protein E4U19_006435 [Claviceps sp. Clav32 group G5]KAG6043169.1 hypothetical protein E4U39_004872 [Claviceps sp. Clav50 group G5]
MRVSAIILSALVAPSAALSFQNVDAQRDIPSNEDLKIPGHTPIEYCPNKKSEGYIKLISIGFSGGVLAFTARVTRIIEKRAYMDLTVKYEGIRLLGTTTDLCQQITEVGLRCPLRYGEISFTRAVTLPNKKNIPPGTYTITADIFSVSHSRITCLTVTVKWPGLEYHTISPTIAGPIGSSPTYEVPGEGQHGFTPPRF